MTCEITISHLREYSGSNQDWQSRQLLLRRSKGGSEKVARKRPSSSCELPWRKQNVQLLSNEGESWPFYPTIRSFQPAINRQYFSTIIPNVNSGSENGCKSNHPQFFSEHLSEFPAKRQSLRHNRNVQVPHLSAKR